jgi:hypothetical protein
LATEIRGALRRQAELCDTRYEERRGETRRDKSRGAGGHTEVVGDVQPARRALGPAAGRDGGLRWSESLSGGRRVGTRLRGSSKSRLQCNEEKVLAEACVRAHDGESPTPIPLPLSLSPSLSLPYLLLPPPTPPIPAHIPPLRPHTRSLAPLPPRPLAPSPPRSLTLAPPPPPPPSPPLPAAAHLVRAEADVRAVPDSDEHLPWGGTWGRSRERGGGGSGKTRTNICRRGGYRGRPPPPHTHRSPTLQRYVGGWASGRAGGRVESQREGVSGRYPSRACASPTGTCAPLGSEVAGAGRGPPRRHTRAGDAQ